MSRPKEKPLPKIGEEGKVCIASLHIFARAPKISLNVLLSVRRKSKRRVSIVFSITSDGFPSLNRKNSTAKIPIEKSESVNIRFDILFLFLKQQRISPIKKAIPPKSIAERVFINTVAIRNSKAVKQDKNGKRALLARYSDAGIARAIIAAEIVGNPQASVKMFLTGNINPKSDVVDISVGNLKKIITS